MDSNVILKNRSAIVLLNEIANSPALRAQIEAYFAPYCDCDIVEWIVGKLAVNDTFVKNKILELIRYVDDNSLIRGNSKPVLGQLIRQYCVDGDLIGIYGDGNGNEVQKTIGIVSEICTGRHSVNFFYPFLNQDALIEQESDNVVFSNNQYDYAPDSVAVEGKAYDSNPRPFRLQIKLQLNNNSDYQDLEFMFASIYDENGLEQYDNPARVPLSSRLYEWRNGVPTYSFNPTTRVVKIKQLYVGEHDRTTYNCNFLVLKKNKLMGFVRLALGIRPYDPDSPVGQSGNHYNSLFVYPGSMN